jgi:hypothetical protein
VPQARLDPAMSVRAEAARELIADGELDPYVGLSFVVWPSSKFAEASTRSAATTGRKLWPEAVKLEAIALVEVGGLSERQASELLGAPRTTVSMWLRRYRRERGLQSPGMPASFAGYWQARASA